MGRLYDDSINWMCDSAELPSEYGISKPKVRCQGYTQADDIFKAGAYRAQVGCVCGGSEFRF